MSVLSPGKLPAGQPLSTVSAETDVGRNQVPILFGRVKDDALALAQHSEEGTLEGAGAEHYLVTFTVSSDDADPGLGVVHLHDTLHTQAFSIFPALIHDVQTRIRLLLLPCRTRTRWMFGNQRRLERLWEKLTCLPNHGSLPQTSHRYDMTGKTS